MRIHTDHNGVAVNAISSTNGTDVEGHLYQVLLGPTQVDLSFQMGPVKDNGVNGLTNEALLAVLAHRLRHLNSKFPCAENDTAISYIDLTLEALEARTRERQARGVEGLNLE